MRMYGVEAEKFVLQLERENSGKNYKIIDKYTNNIEHIYLYCIYMYIYNYI